MNAYRNDKRWTVQRVRGWRSGSQNANLIANLIYKNGDHQPAHVRALRAGGHPFSSLKGHLVTPVIDYHESTVMGLKPSGVSPQRWTREHDDSRGRGGHAWSVAVWKSIESIQYRSTARSILGCPREHSDCLLID